MDGVRCRFISIINMLKNRDEGCIDGNHSENFSKEIRRDWWRSYYYSLFGDSVTQGCFELYKTGENSFETEFRVEDGYHTRLREYLQILYPSVPINMIFAGISGDNALSGLARVERDICAFHPDLTVFCFGLNDCCCGLESLKEYKDSIRGIIDALAGCGTEIIFMTPNMMADSVSPEVTDAYIRKCYAEMIAVSNVTIDTFVQAAKEVCRESGVTVCDCYAA